MCGQRRTPFTGREHVRHKMRLVRRYHMPVKHIVNLRWVCDQIGPRPARTFRGEVQISSGLAVQEYLVLIQFHPEFMSKQWPTNGDYHVEKCKSTVTLPICIATVFWSQTLRYLDQRVELGREEIATPLLSWLTRRYHCVFGFQSQCRVKHILLYCLFFSKWDHHW